MTRASILAVVSLVALIIAGTIGYSVGKKVAYKTAFAEGKAHGVDVERARQTANALKSLERRKRINEEVNSMDDAALREWAGGVFNNEAGIACTPADNSVPESKPPPDD